MKHSFSPQKQTLRMAGPCEERLPLERLDVRAENAAAFDRHLRNGTREAATRTKRRAGTDQQRGGPDVAPPLELGHVGVAVNADVGQRVARRQGRAAGSGNAHIARVVGYEETDAREDRTREAPHGVAGFREVGETKGGLLALQLLPGDMPPPEAARETPP